MGTKLCLDWADQLRVGLTDFVTDPDANPLNTPSGRVEISSATYAETGYPSIPVSRILQTNEANPLRLVTPHPRYRIHSQYDNIPWFMKREMQALWMHPRDAAEQGIATEQQVTVSSPEGRVCIKVRVTEDIMPGVVCLVQGARSSFDADGIDTVGSANVLTSTVPTLPSHGARTHSILVQVALAGPPLS